MNYLRGYPADIQEQARDLLRRGLLGTSLRQRYQGTHAIRTDRALYGYVMDLKDQFLRGAGPLSKVGFDSRLVVLSQALGMHSTVSRVQGSRLKAKREIRVASLFKDLPEAFLRMIAVHELAHLKLRDHDKAFYRLCTYMEPEYHQVELDLRLYLTLLDAGGRVDWSTSADDGD